MYLKYTAYGNRCTVLYLKYIGYKHWLKIKSCTCILYHVIQTNSEDTAQGHNSDT